jgi:hypothetical protein
MMRQQHETPQDAASVPRPARESERQHGFRAIGIAVSKLAAPIIAARGGGILVRLKADWAAIAGADWAAVSWPSALGRDGALKLRAVPPAALELQHRAPWLLERINLFFGRPVVSRLVLVQGTLPADSPSSGPGLRPLAAKNEVERLDEQLSEIGDPSLRAALAGLGRALIARG